MSPGPPDRVEAPSPPVGIPALGRLAERLWWTPPLLYLIVGAVLIALSTWGTPWEQSVLYLSTPVRYATSVEPGGQLILSHPDEAFPDISESHQRGPVQTVYAPMIPTYVASVGDHRVNLMATAYNGGVLSQMLGGVARTTGDGALIAVLVLVLLMGAAVQAVAVLYFRRTFSASVAFYGGLWCALDLCSYGNYMAGIATTAVVQLTLVPTVWTLDHLAARAAPRRTVGLRPWLPFVLLGLMHGVALYNTVPHAIVMVALLAGAVIAMPRVVFSARALLAMGAGLALVCWPMALYPLDFPGSEGDSWSGNPLIFGFQYLGALLGGGDVGPFELVLRNLHHLWLSLARPYHPMVTLFGVSDPLGPDLISFAASVGLVGVLVWVLRHETETSTARRFRLMAVTVAAVWVLATAIAWNPANPHHIWYAWPLTPFLLTAAALRLPDLLGSARRGRAWVRWVTALPLLLAVMHLGHILYFGSIRDQMAQPAVDVRAMRALADELEAAGTLEPVVVSDSLIGVLELTTSGRVRPIHLGEPFGVLGAEETWRRILSGHPHRAYVFTLSGDVDEDHLSDRARLSTFLEMARQMDLEPVPLATVPLTSGVEGFAVYGLIGWNERGPRPGER